MWRNNYLNVGRISVNKLQELGVEQGLLWLHPDLCGTPLLVLCSSLPYSMLFCLQSLHLCVFFGDLTLALPTLADSWVYLGIYIPGAALS